MVVEDAAEKYTFTVHSREALTRKQIRDNNYPAPKAFVYIPLHNIESLWWVLLWMVLCKAPSSMPPVEEKVMQKHNEKVLRAFPQRLDVGSRALLLRLGQFYFEYNSLISPSLSPYLYHLLVMKISLVDSYSRQRLPCLLVTISTKLPGRPHTKMSSK